MRSTLLLASRASLLEAGYRERYLAALEPDARRAIDEAVIGVWMPIAVAEAHYRACDALGLTPEVVAAMGGGTNCRIKGTLYGTFLRLFSEAAGGPWKVLPHCQRFWHRGFEGGGMGIVRLGPMEARIDVVQCSLCESPYFRGALRGLIANLLGLFHARVYVHEMPSGRPRASVSYRVQWA
jgi:hypothetical protein